MSRPKRLHLGSGPTAALALLLLLTQCTSVHREFSPSGAGGSDDAPAAAIAVGEPCDVAGETICAGPQKQRLVCDDGVYQATTPCAAAQSCDQYGNCFVPVAVCGDGMTQSPEECDDGNASDSDACVACRLARCGDGLLGPSEECDDGNALDNDGCTNRCTRPRCGDAIVQASEACDDGNASDTDACSNTCTVPGCGDGVTQSPNEECDDGNQVNTDACTVACKKPKCGDSFVETGEECDDGNTTNADGCSNDCRLAKCGDGVLSAGETCEDGNKTDGDGCSASCQSEFCGDNKKTGTEECDDGNKNDNDGCSAICHNEVCGDGIVQRPREDCEDKNTVDTDLCRNGCKNAATLNALNADCQNTSQITQTVCMVAVTNWCKQFNNSPVAGMVSGQNADNEYRVGCVNGLKRQEVDSSLLDDKCGSGRQQSPACLAAANAACRDLGAYKIGFYVGAGSASGTTALACGAGTKTATESVPNCNGIADTSPVPVACAGALADKCGSGKAGMIQALAQPNQVSYTCVELNLTGTARLR